MAEHFASVSEDELCEKCILKQLLNSVFAWYHELSKPHVCVICLSLRLWQTIIYMKKLLDSDWLRAVQFKCNTGAKSVTTVQITHRNSGLWLTERQKEISKTMRSRKMMTKRFVQKLQMRKKWLQERSSDCFSVENCFHWVVGLRLQIYDLFNELTS